MLFWPFNSGDENYGPQEEKRDVFDEPTIKPVSQFHVMDQQYKEFIKNNLPTDFDKKMDLIKPYAVGSFVAWPLYWTYRGLTWSRTHNARLPMYIQKTYFNAKFLQFSILMLGLSAASMTDIRESSK